MSQAILQLIEADRRRVRENASEYDYRCQAPAWLKREWPHEHNDIVDRPRQTELQLAQLDRIEREVTGANEEHQTG